MYKQPKYQRSSHKRSSKVTHEHPHRGDAIQHDNSCQRSTCREPGEAPCMHTEACPRRHDTYENDGTGTHNRKEAPDTPRHAELTRTLTPHGGGAQAIRLPRPTSPATPHREARRRSKEGPHPDIASTKEARYHRRNLHPGTEIKHDINTFSDYTSAQNEQFQQ